MELRALDGDAPLCQRLTRMFEERLHVEVPSVETDLLETGRLDSLGFVDLLVHLEREFGTEVSPADLELDNFRSIARIAAFVSARTNGGNGT